MILPFALGFLVACVLVMTAAVVAMYRTFQRAARASDARWRDRLAAEIEGRRDDRARHTRETEAIHEFYRVALTSVGNTQQFGTPAPTPASIDREPTPEMELTRQIDQDMLSRGMDALREEYKAAGLTISEDQLRKEIEDVISGRPIQIAPEYAMLADRP